MLPIPYKELIVIDFTLSCTIQSFFRNQNHQINKILYFFVLNTIFQRILSLEEIAKSQDLIIFYEL